MSGNTSIMIVWLQFSVQSVKTGAGLIGAASITINQKQQKKKLKKVGKRQMTDWNENLVSEAEFILNTRQIIIIKKY